MTSVPGGSFEAALSVYDVLRSITAPLRMLGSGHIVGPGVVMYIGVSAGRRFALPHVHFRLGEPRQNSASKTADDLERDAEIARERPDRVRSLLAEVTDQPKEHIQADVAEQKQLDADAAVDYGLVYRVVESRDELS